MVRIAYDTHAVDRRNICIKHWAILAVYTRHVSVVLFVWIIRIVMWLSSSCCLLSCGLIFLETFVFVLLVYLHINVMHSQIVFFFLERTRLFSGDVAVAEIRAILLESKMDKEGRIRLSSMPSEIGLAVGARMVHVHALVDAARN